MSFTNKTPNLNLPQWIDTDTPTWLVDMNNAFEKIDESVTSVKNAGDTNKTNIDAISQTQATQANQIQDLTDKVTADTTQLAQVQAQVNVNTSHLSDLDNEIKQTNETVSDNFTQLQAADTTISNTVNGISATVAEHSNAITELQATTGGYDTRIESVETNIQALENKDVELSGKIQSNETSITSLNTEQQDLSGEVASLSTQINNIIHQPLLVSKLFKQDSITGSYQTNPGRIFLNLDNLRDNHLYLLKITIVHSGGLSQPRDVNILPQFTNENEYFFGTPFIITAGMSQSSWQTTAIFYKSQTVAGSVGYSVNPLNTSTEGWTDSLLRLTITCVPYEFFSVQGVMN